MLSTGVLSLEAEESGTEVKEIRAVMIELPQWDAYSGANQAPGVTVGDNDETERWKDKQQHASSLAAARMTTSVLRTLLGRVELSFLGCGQLGDLCRLLDRHIESGFHLGNCRICAAGAYCWNVCHVVSPYKDGGCLQPLSGDLLVHALQ
jgi:hypothetical protein